MRFTLEVGNNCILGPFLCLVDGDEDVMLNGEGDDDDANAKLRGGPDTHFIDSRAAQLHGANE